MRLAQGSLWGGTARLLLAAATALALYLVFWPGPIEPAAWEAEGDDGFVGDFAANDALTKAEAIDLGGWSGPEDLALGADGALYLGARDGEVLRVADGGVEEVATLGGRPLGLEQGPDGALYVADAYRGLVRLEADGAETLLASQAGGRAIRYANDVDVGEDGLVYLSDSTTRFSAKEEGGTLEASLLDLAEHQRTGRLLVVDPASGETRVLAEGFCFANGVALSRDGRWLALAETGEYRIWKVWVKGPRAGEREILIENLPGFPDNIERDRDGRFWIGLVSPRRAVVDRLASWPTVRSAIFKLPAWLRPGPKPYGALIAIDESGRVVANLQDPSGERRLITGAQVMGDRLYVSSLEGRALYSLPLDSALATR